MKHEPLKKPLEEYYVERIHVVKLPHTKYHLYDWPTINIGASDVYSEVWKSMQRNYEPKTN